MNDMNMTLQCKEKPQCDMPAPGNDCLSGQSLAMVYSPCQSFEGIYAPEEGLCRGTVFMALEKPFWGAGRVK